MAMRNGRPDPAIYERAAEIIEERGLHKSAFCDLTTGRVCALGAIHAAVGERKRIKTVFVGDAFFSAVPADNAEFTIPEEVLRQAGFVDREYDYSDADLIADWNDKPSRRKAQVAAKLREMAEIERSLR